MLEGTGGMASLDSPESSLDCSPFAFLGVVCFLLLEKSEDWTLCPIWPALLGQEAAQQVSRSGKEFPLPYLPTPNF